MMEALGFLFGFAFCMSATAFNISAKHPPAFAAFNGALAFGNLVLFLTSVVKP